MYFKKQGFTIVELMVVIVIVGALLTLTYQLFSDVWDSELSQKSSYSLTINFDKKKMSVQLYDKKNDKIVDSGLQSLWQNEMQKAGRFANDDDKENNNKNEIKYLVHPQRMPNNLKKIYSVSGIEITSRIVNILFYPNGTSDSVIFALGEKSNYKYLFLPNQNIEAKTLYKLDFNQFKEEEYK